jgi:hypothetical protein
LIFLEKIISLKSKNRDEAVDYLKNIVLISHSENQIPLEEMFKKNK